MFAAALAGAAWLLALGALALRGGDELTQPARTALVALPFVLLAGVPRPRAGSGRDDETSLHAGLLVAALALGPLAVAARFDQLAGRPLRETLLSAGFALVAIGLLSAAAQRAAARRAGGARHALAWLALVPGLPLLAGVVQLAPGSGALRTGLEFAARASPLTCCWERARAPLNAPGDAPGSSGWLPLVLAVAGLLLVHLAARAPREERA